MILRCVLRYFFSQINLRSRPGDVGAPMVRIHRILLVDVGLEELVVTRTLVVLEPTLTLVPISVLVFLSSESLRVQLLEVGINEPLLGHFDEGVIVGSGKVTFTVERAEVGLLDDLDCECDIASGWQVISNAAFGGIGSP
jgi:hypothetical protein